MDYSERKQRFAAAVARVPCTTLVAFRCKRRGICPSCGTRRTAETAAALVDHVLPRVPVRQWVLSFPIPPRISLRTPPRIAPRSLFAVHRALLRTVLRIIDRAINTHRIRQTDIKRNEAAIGAITRIERFGSVANLNIPLRGLVLDGV